MNLHSYSQANNRELGVQFSKSNKNDLQIVEECLKEFESIRNHSEKLSSILPTTDKNIQQGFIL